MSTVPGSLFRRVLFWAHLSCGVSAGLLILVMSATGTLLTYERQMIAAKVDGNRVALNGGPALAADQLAAIALASAPADSQVSLVFDADAAMPVTVSMGRESLLLHPETGALLPDAAAGTRAFFQKIEAWHRRLGGESRSLRANLMDLSNLLFVFIIASGIYLWLPAVWRWRTVRGLVLFKTRYVNGKVRDFNWHHVMSFWMLIPLFLVALSGVVISYPWASNLVYAAYGEQAPQRGGPPREGGAPPRESSGGTGSEVETPSARVSYAEQLDTARSQFASWKKITLPLASRGDTVQITAELPSEEIRAPRQTLTLSLRDGSVRELSALPPPNNTQSPGQRARVWFRFVHTGEEYGIVGQTLAGIASLAACFLVYTGLALAWRRLIRPLF